MLSGALWSSPELFGGSPELSRALQRLSRALRSSPEPSKAPSRSAPVVTNRQWLWLQPVCDHREQLVDKEGEESDSMLPPSASRGDPPLLRCA
eukprot:2069920-Alexandrium_andersonii.AAC.1